MEGTDARQAGYPGANKKIAQAALGDVEIAAAFSDAKREQKLAAAFSDDKREQKLAASFQDDKREQNPKIFRSR